MAKLASLTPTVVTAAAEMTRELPLVMLRVSPLMPTAVPVPAD